LPDSSSENSVGFTGADIDNRMNSLFGEERCRSLWSGFRSIDAIDNDSEENSQNPDEAGSMQPVSGKDISSRIDELFDISESNLSDTPSVRKGDITEKSILRITFLLI
jgi:hypothetical protein